MGELARGTVLDRPWGQTLAALASRGLTGEVTVISDGKPYLVAFSEGIVVAASSPLGSDAAVRVALTGHLVSSTQVADIVRRQAAAPHREEIEVLAEAARLDPDQAMRLRRRMIAQRAARTFAVDRGDFVVDDMLTLAVVAGSALDVRTVVYLGARSTSPRPAHLRARPVRHVVPAPAGGLRGPPAVRLRRCRSGDGRSS